MHSIHVALIPPFQETKQSHILLPHGWKMQLIDDTKLQNAVVISTDYFGGAGEQSATVIQNGVELKPLLWNTNKYYPINDALKYFGLTTEEGKDEFDTINLGHYRSMEDVSESLPSEEAEEAGSYKFEKRDTALLFPSTDLLPWVQKIVDENFKDKVVWLHNPNFSFFNEIEDITIGNSNIRVFDTSEDFLKYLTSDERTENIVDNFSYCWVNGKHDNGYINEVRG